MEVNVKSNSGLLLANSRGSQEKQVYPNTGKLTWKDGGDGERAGRMELFKGSYLAYRNRRAHRGPKGTAEKALMESPFCWLTLAVK